MAITTTIGQVQAAYLQINRVPLNDASAQAVATAIDNGVTTLAAYQAGLVAQASTTTTAAYALSTFIEGVVPTSERIDSLTAFAKTQVEYYTNTLKSANAQLGAYEALGKAFAADASTSATFEARYGALSATDFVNSAYASIFNNAPVPSAGALANLVAQVNYFTGIYTAAGIPAAAAALQAKGAVLGQIIGYAATGTDDISGVDPSTFDNQIEGLINQTVTEAIAETTPSGVYGVGTLGKTIVVTGDVSPTAAGILQSTQFGDKITGTLGLGGLLDGIKVDGGLGVDTLNVITTAGTTAYAPSADTVKNIEIMTVKSAGAAATVDLTNVAGLTKFTLAAGSDQTLGVTALGAATELHIAATDAAADLTVGYTAAPAAAKVFIDANYAGAITFSDAAVKSVDVQVTASASGVNFADDQLTSVTVTSKGSVSVGTIGTGLKTLDLTGVGTFSTSNLSGNAFANAVTVKLDKGADVFEMDVNKGHQITLGAGADTVELNQLAPGNVTDISTNAKVVASIATVTDFAKAEDILRLDGTLTNRTALDNTQLGQIAAATDILGAATAAGAISAVPVLDSWVIFNFGTDAYALYDLGNNGFTANDTLIKLTGVQVADLTATNLFLV